MIDRSLFTLPKVGMILGLLLVFSLGEAACVIGQAYALSRAITNLWDGGLLADQTILVATFAACFFGKQAFVFVRDTILASYAHKQADTLRVKLLSRVFGSQIDAVAQHGSASISQAALEGIDQTESYLALILPKIVGLVAIPLPILIVVFSIDWVSGLILLVLFPIIIFYMILLGRQASARAEAQFDTYNALSNHFIDTLRGIETLKVFGQSKSFAKRIFDKSEEFRFATIETLKTATLSGAVLDLIATLGVAAVAMMLGFRLVGGSILLFGSLMCLVLAPEYFKPIREFAGDFHASLDGKNALAHVISIISDEQDTQRSVDLAPWDGNARLTLKGVDFAYDAPGEGDGSAVALRDIHLNLQGMSKVALVGVSGSGKSTLVNLLGGFLEPTGGTIELSGVSLHGLRLAAWQRQLLYIPQNPYVFHASLRDNLCFYSPNATDDQVREAVAVVGLDQLVSELPEGLDTIIGEGGRGLSGGQAQRIALARALLDPSRKVLLFDEPTAHLDIETELELKDRMLPLMEGRLVVFATHRLHWLEAMDCIIVLEDGRIVEHGTLDELLARKGKLVELISTMNRGDVA